jgi:hypothetical protein
MHCDNEPLHNTFPVQHFLEARNMAVMHHLHYSLDLALMIPFFLLTINHSYTDSNSTYALSLYKPNRHRGEAQITAISCCSSELEGGWWSVPHPDHFTPRKETQYPLYRRLGGPRDQCGWARKILPTLRFEPSTVQPVASHYTNCANLAVHHFQDVPEIQEQYLIILQVISTVNSSSVTSNGNNIEHTAQT